MNRMVNLSSQNGSSSNKVFSHQLPVGNSLSLAAAMESSRLMAAASSSGVQRDSGMGSEALVPKSRGGLLSDVSGSRNGGAGDFVSAALRLSHATRGYPLSGLSSSSGLGLGSDPQLLLAVAEQQAAENRRMEFVRATIVAAETAALRQRAVAEEAYKRGHDEALLSLVRNGAVTQMSGSAAAAGHNGVSEAHSHATTTAEPRQQNRSKKPEDLLEALGSSLKKKNSEYIDASALKDPDPSLFERRRTRGGVTEPFPEKLHRMLRELEETGNADIISFFPHGRAFGVHKPEKFVNEVLPKWFKQTRLSSFQRQLNLYGFTRISSGPDAGGYYHELFLKGRPALCFHMQRVGVPQGGDRRKSKKKGERDPHFYNMKSIDNERS